MSTNWDSAIKNEVVVKKEGLSVLIVDDDQDTREMYAEHLKYNGFTVVTARDGEDALERLRETLPHVIVTDLSLPTIDGRELISRVRQDERLRGVPLIVLSGRPDSRKVRRLDESSPIVFLLKPCTPNALVAEIERVLTA